MKKQPMPSEPHISVEIDNEEEELVISLEAGDYEMSQRLRPLDAWLLLYLLAPDWNGWTDAGIAFCENVFANQPPVGLAQTNKSVLLSLPHGAMSIPAKEEAQLTEALKQTLPAYTESLGLE